MGFGAEFMGRISAADKLKRAVRQSLPVQFFLPSSGILSVREKASGCEMAIKQFMTMFLNDGARRKATDC